MNKEFIPYEQALELKELGFNEECMAYYEKWIHQEQGQKIMFMTGLPSIVSDKEDITLAPLYQQAFRWFREKYGIVGIVKFGTQEFTYNVYNNDAIGLLTKDSLDFNGTYEEAEIACLKKLIELVKGKEVAINCHTYD
jgi:hypothetical protein